MFLVVPCAFVVCVTYYLVVDDNRILYYVYG